MGKKLRKLAEDYGGGSSGIDYLSTSDGSETLQDGINVNEQSCGDGQGATPAGGQANHPVTPYGEQGHYHDDEPGDDEGPTEIPYGEALVDDNHADGGGGLGSLANRGLLRFFTKKADETNFFLQNSTSGGVADSPQTMDDGHPYEELSDPGALQQIFNNDAHPTNEADVSIVRDPKLVDKEKDDSPQVNKGGIFAHLKSRPFMSTSIGSTLFKKAYDPETDYRNHSNVSDIMNPHEEDSVHYRATHDFGTGDKVGDGIPMAVAPLQGDGQTEEEKNYSGRENSTAGLLGLFSKISSSKNMFDASQMPDYMYHATNHYNAADIAESGLKTFLPNYGTEDQHYWPDGKREKRSYFSHDPKITESFAPSEGQKVTLRVPFKKAPFLKEKGTGDFYSKKPIKSEHIEYQHDDGSWKPISNLNNNINQAAGLLNFFIKQSETEQEKHPDWYDKNGKLKCGNCGKTDYNDIRGRCCDKCMMKKADYAGVIPSANPNSGQDEDNYPDSNGQTYSQNYPAMTDGKVNADHMNDKVFNDPSQYRKNLNYNRNRAPDEDTSESYFSTINSGSGMGMEGDGDNFSGVNNV